MRKKITIVFEDYDRISENTEEKLLGGFSQSITFQPRESVMGDPTDNCHGGNCAYGCGPGANVGCNTVAGCGTK